MDKLSHVIFKHTGCINQDTVEQLVYTTNEYFILQKKNSALIKRIKFILTECLQNIVHHSYSSDTDLSIDSNILVKMHANSTHCYISTSNPISNQQSETLDNYLRYINNLTKEALHQYFLNKLNKEKSIFKRSAKLGLIEIIRKSEKPIAYSILNFNSNYSIVEMEVKIDL